MKKAREKLLRCCIGLLYLSLRQNKKEGQIPSVKFAYSFIAHL